jgi:hypothetical protein
MGCSKSTHAKKNTSKYPSDIVEEFKTLGLSPEVNHKVLDMLCVEHNALNMKDVKRITDDFQTSYEIESLLPRQKKIPFRKLVDAWRKKAQATLSAFFIFFTFVIVCSLHVLYLSLENLYLIN